METEGQNWLFIIMIISIYSALLFPAEHHMCSSSLCLTLDNAL